MSLNKKLITFILVPAALLIMPLIYASSSQQNSTKVFSVQEKIEITIDPHLTTDQSLLMPPYKSVSVFISEEQSADFEFTSVGGSWDELSPEGTNIEAQVRFKGNGQWGDWLDLEEEEDKNIEGRVYGMASTNPAQAMQYKYILYGDEILTPRVINPEWTFIRTSSTENVAASPQPQYASSPILSRIRNLALNTNSQMVISREVWGADESYRYLKDQSIDPVLLDIDAETRKKFAEELKHSRIIERDEEGQKYKWPLQYSGQVKKIVLHHTATSKNLDNPMQAIRDIYYYHAVTRAWGDIGYNYIVDQEGQIYEGRYGGEGVIGAHSGIGNNGSIGIAVLGNYEETEVPEKVVASISQFVWQKAKVHKIDPKGFSGFRGELSANILGHSDIMNTTCPGTYLYSKLPIIRALAAENKKEKEKFVKDYEFEDKSELYYLELNPDETREITVTFENIGKVDWNNQTYIVVDDNPEFKDVISFPERKNEILATMREKLVKPGEKATFKFKVKSTKKAEIVYMKITPLMNGFAKNRDYMILPVAIRQPDYKYKYIDSKYPPKAMKSGEEFKGWVKLQNIGNITWRNMGENTVTLGADHNKDRKSLFATKNPTRLGYLMESEVKPGETGTFEINIKAPTNKGFYKEYFTPVLEGISWMPDSGMHFDTTVYTQDYEAEVTEIESYENWIKGGTHNVKIKLRNMGGAVWTPSNLKLNFFKSASMKIENVKLEEDKVETGDIGTIGFTAKLSKNAKNKKSSFKVLVKVDNKSVSMAPIFVKYNAVDENEIPKGSGEEGNIRIKLSFFDNPEISASGSFEIYDGGQKLATLNAGEIANVTKANGGYKIATAKNTFITNNPVRFFPLNVAILRIENFEHRPSWNETLNDNEYRGILEVRDVDGSLNVINELPLEDYLKGLAEVSNTEEPEKVKAIMTAARTYAKHYMKDAEKFPGKPYNLDDDPAVSQKYLGFGFEKRAPNIGALINATRGEVITYKGQLVKTPYFNQSDGTKTKNAKDVWNWDAPYLVSVDDSYCKGKEFLGHGVGLSGCGAKAMAEAGKTYIQILKHYYTGIEITDLY